MYNAPNHSSPSLPEQRLLELAHALPGRIPSENHRPLRIPGRCDCWVLREALEHLYPRVPASEWRELVKTGHFLAPGGQPADLEQTVRAGQEFTSITPGETEPDVSADIRLIYEDQAMIVVHKPAPLPVHPGGRFNRNTLRHLLSLAWQPESPRHCHRLDSNTTGVLVCVRERRFSKLVQQQFDKKQVDKLYLAKVWGHVTEDEFEIDLPIDAKPGKFGLRRLAPTNEGLASLTKLKVLSRNQDGTSTLEVVPVTGRTHQIRLHLWHIGHPIVGDPAYLRGLARGQKQTLELGEAPMHLHCREMRLKHPISGETVSFRCEPSWL